MDGSDSNKVYQFQFTTDYDWQYYWTTYGLSYQKSERLSGAQPWVHMDKYV